MEAERERTKAEPYEQANEEENEDDEAIVTEKEGDVNAKDEQKGDYDTI